MRASTAFFAGAGTVIVAIAAGLGGGLVMGNIMSPQQGHHAFSRFERRSPSHSWPITTAKTADAPVPYLAATEKAIAKPMVVPPSHGAAQKIAGAVAKPVSATKSVSTAKPATSPQSQPSPIQQASRDQASSDPDNANAEARDADLKRPDAKKNRSDRRRQWAARRVQQQQQLQDQREADDQAWNDNRDGNKGWDDRRRSGDNRGWRNARSGSREMIVRRDDPDESDRPLFGPPRGFDFPHFDLFGRD